MLFQNHKAHTVADTILTDFSVDFARQNKYILTKVENLKVNFLNVFAKNWGLRKNSRYSECSFFMEWFQIRL